RTPGPAADAFERATARVPHDAGGASAAGACDRSRSQGWSEPWTLTISASCALRRFRRATGRGCTRAHRICIAELACRRTPATRAGACVSQADLTRVITLAEAGVAQAVFGPLHRHLAHIQEAFRDPNASRGAPAYRVTLDAQGDRLTVRARAG